jgi:hypothetical protein
MEPHVEHLLQKQLAELVMIATTEAPTDQHPQKIKQTNPVEQHEDAAAHPACVMPAGFGHPS